MRGDTYTYMNLEGSGDILASRRNTPASRFFFLLLWTHMHARAGCCSPPLVRPFFSTRDAAPADPSAKRRMMMIHRRAAGAVAAQGATLGGFLVGEVGGLSRIILFSVCPPPPPPLPPPSSSSSLLSLSAHTPALPETPSKRGEDLKTNKKTTTLYSTTKNYPWIFALCAQSQIRPLPVESELPLAPSVYLRGIPTPCTGHFLEVGTAADARRESKS